MADRSRAQPRQAVGSKMTVHLLPIFGWEWKDILSDSPSSNMPPPRRFVRDGYTYMLDDCSSGSSLSMRTLGNWNTCTSGSMN